MRIQRRPEVTQVPTTPATPPVEPQVRPARADAFSRTGDGSVALPVAPRPANGLSPLGALISARTTSVDGPHGPQQGEGDAAFAALKPFVSSGTLRPADRLLLADAVAQVGILGFSQAVKAARLLEGQPAATRAEFLSLVDAAQDNTARAFLFKALAAGHSPAELKAFASSMAGMGSDELIQTLNLGDATAADDGKQNGVKQQFKASCVPTTAQVLRGEMDPIYALAVRRANTDVNAADDGNGTALNAGLAGEQKVLLETVGLGTAVPRAMSGGGGSQFDAIDDVCNTMSPWTGFTYAGAFLDDQCTDAATVNTALNGLAAQLDLGIPTPILVGIDCAPKAHCAVALEARGEGPGQQFLIHDPWTGLSSWVTRQAFVEGHANLGTCQVLGAWYPATPA